MKKAQNLEEALKNIYIVKSNIRETAGVLSLPKCFIGKRIKIVIEMGSLIEEEK